jgi:hypothetical protein
MTDIPEKHYKALKIINENLTGKNINWAITGSVGMVLQGMSMEVHDIDLQADKAGVYAIEEALASYSIKPVYLRESLLTFSYYGVLEIEGIQVEIIGAIQKKVDNGDWEEPVDPEEFCLQVSYKDLTLPVMSLEHEYEAYQIMGRLEKAARIRAFLDSQQKQPVN